MSQEFPKTLCSVPQQFVNPLRNTSSLAPFLEAVSSSSIQFPIQFPKSQAGTIAASSEGSALLPSPPTTPPLRSPKDDQSPPANISLTVKPERKKIKDSTTYTPNRNSSFERSKFPLSTW
jgi:hypothetical protein